MRPRDSGSPKRCGVTPHFLNSKILGGQLVGPDRTSYVRPSSLYNTLTQTWTFLSLHITRMQSPSGGPHHAALDAAPSRVEPRGSPCGSPSPSVVADVPSTLVAAASRGPCARARPPNRPSASSPGHPPGLAPARHVPIRRLSEDDAPRTVPGICIANADENGTEDRLMWWQATNVTHSRPSLVGARAHPRSRFFIYLPRKAAHTRCLCVRRAHRPTFWSETALGC